MDKHWYFKTALGKTWNAMDWNGMEFYHEFLKGTFSIYLQPPPPLNPNDHLTPTPKCLLSALGKAWNGTEWI